ncbi:MAG: hypothetical protein AB2614_21225, partial [Candidatus Thiodiazotropha endolucinida]
HSAQFTTRHPVRIFGNPMQPLYTARNILLGEYYHSKNATGVSRNCLLNQRQLLSDPNGNYSR